MPKSTIAALQIGSYPAGKSVTLSNIVSFGQAIIESGAKLVVLPEVVLGDYPKGRIFGTRVGYRLPARQETLSRYFENAIDLPGLENKALADLSKRTKASLVVGAVERSGSTLYCTSLFYP